MNFSLIDVVEEVEDSAVANTASDGPPIEKYDVCIPGCLLVVNDVVIIAKVKTALHW